MWQNPCGGRAWDQLPDGLIEIEGEGAPVYEPDSPQYRQLEQTWRNWGRLLRRAAQKHGVPLPWLLAIATMETGYWSDGAAKQQTITSGAGAIGIMQVMPAVARAYGYDADQMFEPEANIDVGAQVLAYHLGRLGNQLPMAAAGYNSGRVNVCDESPCKKCNAENLYADGDYPSKVIRWNNTALTYLDMGSRAPIYFGVALGLGGLTAAWAILTGRWRPSLGF